MRETNFNVTLVQSTIMSHQSGYSKPANPAYGGIAHPIRPYVGTPLGLSILRHDCPKIDRGFGVSIFKGIKMCLIILDNQLVCGEDNPTLFVNPAVWSYQKQFALEFLGVVATLRSGNLKFAEYNEELAVFTFVFNELPGYQMMRGTLDGNLKRQALSHHMGLLAKVSFIPNPVAQAFVPGSSHTLATPGATGAGAATATIRKIRFDSDSEGEDCPFVILPGEIAAFDTSSNSEEEEACQPANLPVCFDDFSGDDDTLCSPENILTGIWGPVMKRRVTGSSDQTTLIEELVEKLNIYDS